MWNILCLPLPLLILPFSLDCMFLSTAMFSSYASSLLWIKGSIMPVLQRDKKRARDWAYKREKILFINSVVEREMTNWVISNVMDTCCSIRQMLVDRCCLLIHSHDRQFNHTVSLINQKERNTSKMLSCVYPDVLWVKSTWHAVLHHHHPDHNLKLI